MSKLNGILNFYTKYMAIWVIALSVVAYFLPGPFIRLKPFLNAFFAVTMFGIGVTLHASDFKKIAASPMAVAFGVAAQFSIMPLGAFLLSRIFDLPPTIALGLILTGSAPGAMASNVITYIARADVAYSVSLTSVSTLLTPIVTPGLIYVLANSIISVPFWEMFISLMGMVILPLIVGIALRHLWNDRIEPCLKVFPAISSTFIVFICALVIALNRERLADITGMVLLTVLLLNIGGMLLGYAVAKAAKFDMKRRRTLSIEIGMQNAGLGTVLALKHFAPETAVPAAAFVFICIFTASIMAEIWRARTPVT